MRRIARRHGRREQRDLARRPASSCRIRSTSSMKPMRSISSASSSTSVFSSRQVERAACRGGRSRGPGVPTTTCTPRLQRLQLRAVALAAVDRQHVEAGHVRGVASGTPRRPGSPARASAPAPAPAAACCVEVDARQDRQRERRGLAGAGLRLAEHVAAGQQRRDGRGLDRRGRFVADVGERADQGLRSVRGRGTVGDAGCARGSESWGRDSTGWRPPAAIDDLYSLV